MEKPACVVTDPLAAANSFVKPDIVSVAARKDFP